MAEPTDNLVLELLRAIRREVTDVRREVRDVRTLTLQNAEYSRRLERRMSELGDDLELMLKAELMGRLGHFEMLMEQRLEALSERMAAIETRWQKCGGSVPACPREETP